MADRLFPQIPEDVSGLSDDELNALLQEGQEALDRVEQGETDGRSQADVLDELAEGVEALQRVRDEQGRRAEKAAEDGERMAELISRGRGGEEPAGEEGEEEQEPEAGEDEGEEKKDEPEAVAASAKPARRRLAVANPRGRHRPQEEQRERIALTASADVPGFGMGQKLESARDVAAAMTAKYRNIGKTSDMRNEKVPVAHMAWEYPDERTLGQGDSADAVLDKVRRAVGGAPIGHADREAVVAAGGLCAPVEILYDLQVLAQADRPVRDSLTNFQATRGGVRFASPPSLASITTGVGRITEAADAAGGSGAVKACQTITCPQFQEVDVAAIYHCLQFGNLGARAFPEQVAQAVELTMAAWARVAETALLDGIKSASTKATVALQPNNTTPLGATATLLPALLRAATGLRNRHRMDPEAILDVWLPAWALDILTSDIIRSAFDRFTQSDASIQRTIESFGLRVHWYLDGSSDGAQVFGAQSNNAALLSFPTTIEFAMAPAGSFLFLDGGTLDLGLVRDSVLNATNDYQMFGESWENIAFIGVESLWVTVSVCDTGAVAAGVAAVCGS